MKCTKFPITEAFEQHQFNFFTAIRLGQQKLNFQITLFPPVGIMIFQFIYNTILISLLINIIIVISIDNHLNRAVIEIGE